MTKKPSTFLPFSVPFIYPLGVKIKLKQYAKKNIWLGSKIIPCGRNAAQKNKSALKPKFLSIKNIENPNVYPKAPHKTNKKGIPIIIKENKNH